MADETFKVRGQLFMAELDELTAIIGEHGLDTDLEGINRAQAVAALDAWLLEQVKGPDGGKTVLLSISSYFTTASKEPEVIKIDAGETDESKPDPKEIYSKIRLREFKISGQVDIKAGISFTSLVRQIESGIKRGYPEIDIIDGVIRAIPTTSGLRNYLEGREELTLSTLRAVLRAHYREKSATERYSELGAARQTPKEEPAEFLMRAMDVRNKIIFSSQESESGLKYDPALVHGLFVRSVSTGIQDLAIIQEFRVLPEKRVPQRQRKNGREHKYATPAGTPGSDSSDSEWYLETGSKIGPPLNPNAEVFHPIATFENETDGTPSEHEVAESPIEDDVDDDELHHPSGNDSSGTAPENDDGSESEGLSEALTSSGSSEETSDTGSDSGQHKRKCKRPKRLTYDALGNPSYVLTSGVWGY